MIEILLFVLLCGMYMFYVTRSIHHLKGKRGWIRGWLLKDKEKQRSSITYLDYAGSNIPLKGLLDAVHEELKDDSYSHGNPHSIGVVAGHTALKIKKCREAVLDFFKTDNSQYEVIWTSGCTGALSLLASSFPWSEESSFAYTRDCHTSVLGVREIAAIRGAKWSCANNSDLKAILSGAKYEGNEKNGDGHYNLFAFPAECNFSGARYDLEIIEKINKFGVPTINSKGKWCVVLDAAKYCSTTPLDLSKIKPEFCTVSFYKIFGYPTGLGALLVKKDVSHLLHKKYFGGGTIQHLSIDPVGQELNIYTNQTHKKKLKLSERLEDGSLNFLGIVALNHAIRIFNLNNVLELNKRAKIISNYVQNELAQIKYINQAPLAVFYGNWNNSSGLVGHNDQGCVVTFNLLKPDGSFIGFSEVESCANMYKIQLRSGCMCNPGACQHYLKLSHFDISQQLAAGKVCGDSLDLINDKPTGAIRISFGSGSTYDDANMFLKMIKECFINVNNATCNDKIEIEPINNSSSLRRKDLFLSKIYLYPIKSCSSISASEWPLDGYGLMFDREFAVASLSGETLSQKEEPLLVQINPKIDIVNKKMFISAPGKRTLEINLDYNSDSSDSCVEFGVCSGISRLGTIIKGTKSWFSDFLQRPCYLIRLHKSPPLINVISSKDELIEKEESKKQGNFSNSAPFLVVSQASINDIGKQTQQTVHPLRFRPNFVVDGKILIPYNEVNWNSIEFVDKERKNSVSLDVVNDCVRCKMVDIAQGKGDDGNTSTALERKYEKSVLSYLSKNRKVNGKMVFGKLCKLNSENLEEKKDNIVKVGMSIVVNN